MSGDGRYVEPLRRPRGGGHDLVVVLLRGRGSMRLGEESRAVGEGSIVYVPRGSVHAFTNEADTPAFAYVLYTPPFDGEDRVRATTSE